MRCNDKIISDNNCDTLVINEEFSNLYIYIYILQLNQTNSTQSLTIIKEYEDDEIRFNIGLDGFYTLCKLRILRNDLEEIPTLEEKFELLSSEEKEEFINKGITYYSNGKFYYKPANKTILESKETSIQELVEINHTLTNVDITYYYYFLVCRLQECYANLAKKVLDERLGINCSNSRVNKEDIYIRDLVWSALNVILHLAEKGQYEEAERLLESIVGCNKLCNDYSDCGCK